MFPVYDTKTQVHVYGVIISYNKAKNQLKIKDETTECFEISFNNTEKLPRASKDEPRTLPLIAGDIIRLHRVMLCPEFTQRCPKAHNVVV